MPRTTYDFSALSLREKASVTLEELRKDFLPYRLMQQGVKPPVPPVLVPVPERPETTPVTVYELVIDGVDTSVAFTDPSALEKVLALGPVRIESDWTLSYHHKIEMKGFKEGRDGKTRIQSTSVLPPKQWEALGAWGSDAKKAKEANEAAEKEAKSANDDVEEAFRALLDEWRTAHTTVGEFNKILATKADYQRMAGNDEVARRFLLNTYSEEKVLAAEAYDREGAPETGEGA